jgi:hypothetical protein
MKEEEEEKETKEEKWMKGTRWMEGRLRWGRVVRRRREGGKR